MALFFAKAGASYVAVGARSDMSQLAKDVEAAALSASQRFFPIKLDVTNGQSVKNAAAEVEKEFGKLPILGNHAGVLGKFGIIAESNHEERWLVLTSMFAGHTWLPALFCRSLSRAKGNVSSMSRLSAHISST